eukprot:142327-Rhodomonas_salina.3
MVQRKIARCATEPGVPSCSLQVVPFTYLASCTEDTQSRKGEWAGPGSREGAYTPLRACDRTRLEEQDEDEDC